MTPGDPSDNATAGSGGGTPHHVSSSFPRLEGVEHRYVDLPGLRMHVAEAGHGDPVLLLHGFPQHWWEWRGVIPGLARHHHVIAPDLRGAGWTDAPPAGYTRDRLLADVVALLDELGLDRVHMIAHDWGALVGFGLCLDHPDRVRSFVCLATPHPFIRFDPRLLAVLWRLWFQVVIVTPFFGPLALRSGRQRFARFLLRGYTSPRHAWSEEDIEVFVTPLREVARARAGSALYRGFILPEAVRILTGAYRGARLRTPTLALYGADDPGVRPDLLGGFEDHADDMAVTVVDDASHFVADERPDVVVARALELFARH